MFQERDPLFYVKYGDNQPLFIKNKRDLEEIAVDNEKALKDFIKDNRIKVRDEEDMVKVVEFLNEYRITNVELQLEYAFQHSVFVIR